MLSHNTSMRYLVQPLEFYQYVDAVFDEALKRGISVVLEDHGDFPKIYKTHIDHARSKGYETVLMANNCSKENLFELLWFKHQSQDAPIFWDWTIGYHQRINEKIESLKPFFDVGAMYEKIPSFSENGPNYQKISMFINNGKDIREEIYDQAGYKRFRDWGKESVFAPIAQEFCGLDAVMSQYTHSLSGGTSGTDRRRGMRGFWTEMIQGQNSQMIRAV